MKTRMVSTGFVALALLAATTLSFAQQTTNSPAQEPVNNAPPISNPNKVALLKWYINQSTDFPVGNVPYAVAFDGANIWTANYGDDTVTKLRANDGTNLGTFAVGTEPYALAYDGANVWVANLGSDNVTKLRASDGAVMGTFNVGKGPAFSTSSPPGGGPKPN